MAAPYWLLTLPRTCGSAVLFLFAVFGALLYFVEWTLQAWLFTSPVGLLDVTIATAAAVLSLGLPAWLLFRSRAGEQATLFDGLALGAFTGIGFAFVEFLARGIPPGPVFAWPPGSIETALRSLVSGTRVQVVWAGPAAWGALLGLAVALSRRRAIPRLLGQGAALGLVAVVFLELLSGWVLHHRLQGGADTTWFKLVASFHWIDASGRGGGRLLLLGLVLAVVMELWTRRSLAAFPTLRLPGEPEAPGLATELHAQAAALGKGRRAVVELRRFFAARRRLATLQGERGTPGSGGEPVIAAAAEAAAGRLYRAELALSGGPLPDDDRPPRLRAFVGGLVTTVGLALVFMFIVAWLGILLSSAMRGPVGYVCAAAVATGVAYTIGFFREDLGGWLGRRGVATPPENDEEWRR
jgi:hypothetical protein